MITEPEKAHTLATTFRARYRSGTALSWNEHRFFEGVIW